MNGVWVAVVAGLVALGVAFDHVERRLDERERNRYERASRERLLREIRRQP